MKIKEIIVVEGRDDTSAIKKSVDAVTIETHGYGINMKTWALLEKAHREKGIIVFTDPDYAGERIRRRITERFPDAGQAFLDRDDAEKDGDIGIENASPESIREALKKAHCSVYEADGADGKAGGSDAAPFTTEDMTEAGLVGQADSARRRQSVGKELGIGYCNGKTFLQRLNRFGITRDEFDRAVGRHR